MKQIIEVLQEKWKNIQKKYKNFSLFICPLEDLWIPNEITFFSADENSKAFDIGDIFTGYGCPSTNTLFMQYQWNESPIHKTLQKNIADTNVIYKKMIKENLYFESKDSKKKNNFNHTIGNNSNNNNNNICSNNNINTHRSQSHQTQKINENDNDIIATSMFLNNSNIHHNISNSLLAQPTIYDGSPKDSLNNSQVKVEDFLNSVNESEDEKEKSFVPLEQEYDEFDPLEFLGIYNLNLNNIAENANSSDGDIDEFHFILDDNYDCVWRDNNGKNGRNVKSSEHNINDHKKVSAFESPKKITDSDNFICDDSDPYKGIDYFSKIRKNKNSNQETNTGNNLLKAFTVSECHSNLSNNNNQLNNTNFNNNKSNLYHNPNDSQNTENFNKILNFNDLNSKIKSNTLTLNSLTNVNEGKNEKINTKNIFQTTSNHSYSKEKLLQNNSINNKISTPNKSIKKHSPSTPKRMTRRIPFINNQKTNSEEQSNTNNNFLNNLHNSEISQNNVIASTESNKDNNLNVFSFPQNEYNTQLTSILSKNLKFI